MQLTDQKTHQVLIFNIYYTYINYFAFSFHTRYSYFDLFIFKLGIDQKSIVDENSYDVIVNCNPSAKQSKTNVSFNEVEKEKCETNFSSLR